jgi:hypothetical protein
VVSGPDVAGGVERIVTLGASNLTRGFHTVVSTARAVWGPQVQVFAAFGHGRSYGAHSHVLVRTLPGILDTGLFRDLDALPPVPTRALVTDVGNDILYGFPGEQVVAWVETAIDRLERTTRDITLTDLPLASIRRLSRARFLAFRSMLFPSCRLSHAQAVDAAERVNAGLEELSAVRGLRFFRLKPAWYGLDPIHIRPSLWRTAWQEILGCGPAAVTGRDSQLEGLRLYLMPPERRWLFGIEQRTPQTGRALASGGRVWLY